MTQEERLAELEKEANRIHSIFVDNETHCYVMAEVIAIRGAMGVSVADELIRIADKKSPAYKQFIMRVGAMSKIASDAKVYAHNTAKRLKDLYSEEKFDDNVGYLSGHINNLYNMSPLEVTLAMNATEMIKNGNIPTFLNLSTVQLQEVAKKTNIPYEYIAKIINELQNVSVNE